MSYIYVSDIHVIPFLRFSTILKLMFPPRAPYGGHLPMGTQAIRVISANSSGP